MKELNELINSVECQCFFISKGQMLFTIKAEAGIFIPAYERKIEAEYTANTISTEFEADEPVKVKVMRYKHGKKEMIQYMNDLCRSLGCSGIRYIRGNEHRDMNLKVMNTYLSLEE